MKLFEVQTNLSTYTYPAIKVILSISVVLVCINRNKLFCFSKDVYNIIASILSFILVLICILIVYISIGEIFHIYSNRNHHISTNDPISFSVDELVTIANREDIVEIDIITTRGVFRIGSSSNNRFCESEFFDKQFYIGSRVFNSIEPFADELMHYSENGMINVLAIDGLPLKQ